MTSQAQAAVTTFEQSTVTIALTLCCTRGGGTKSKEPGGPSIYRFPDGSEVEIRGTGRSHKYEVRS